MEDVKFTPEVDQTLDISKVRRIAAVLKLMFDKLNPDSVGESISKSSNF
jgi:hypothetical protein